MRIVTIISITADKCRRMRRASGGQTIDGPAPTHLPGPPHHAPVAQPVMQPERASLPELHRVGFEKVPAPEVRHRDLPRLWPASLQLGDTVIQDSPRRDHGRLPAGPRPDLGEPGPRPVVGLALGLRQLADRALDDHLALEAVPREHQAGRRVPGEFPALTRGAVAVEGEPGPVMSFQ